MKKTCTLLVALFIFTVAFSIIGATPANAIWDNYAHRPYRYFCWENSHATMINSLLLSANDEILRCSDKYVDLAKEYSCRDCLLRGHGLKEYCSDSEMDAFLIGLKTNNLIYLIHSADSNPAAKAMAIKELRLLNCIVRCPEAKDQFIYWAGLLEGGNFPSTRLSHMYVHYTINVGDMYSEQYCPNLRFYYWLGYLINDFTVANMASPVANNCVQYEWLCKDQNFLKQLYGDSMVDFLPRSVVREWCCFNKLNCCKKEDIDKAQSLLNCIKAKYTDRQMGSNLKCVCSDNCMTTAQCSTCVKAHKCDTCKKCKACTVCGEKCK